MLNTNLDVIVKWFVLCIVLVFDPLAIALLVAYNFIHESEKLESPATERDIREAFTKIMDIEPTVDIDVIDKEPTIPQIPLSGPPQRVDK